MNIVRWEVVTGDGTADFQVQYGKKVAKIRLEGLDTTGEAPWKDFYLKRFQELFDAIQAKDTRWTDRPGTSSGGEG